MSMDELIKYVIWVVVFAGASFGIYRLMNSLGAA